MPLKPSLTIGGDDVSRYLTKVVLDQDNTSDPDSLHFILSNVHGRFNERWNTDHSIEYTMRKIKSNCESDSEETYKLASGEVQDINYGSHEVDIHGSCHMGKFSQLIGPVPELSNWVGGQLPVGKVVDILLDHFQWKGSRDIDPIFYTRLIGAFDVQDISYEEAFQELGTEENRERAWWWSDENYKFRFKDPKSTGTDSYTDLDPYLTDGNSAKNVIGYANEIIGVGGALVPQNEEGCEVPTHNPIIVKAINVEEQKKNGKIVAPWIHYVYNDMDEMIKIAEGALDFYTYMDDKVQLVTFGFSPAVGSRVYWTMKSAKPYNNDEMTCSPDRIEWLYFPLVGIVTKRHIEQSVQSGWVTTLDVNIIAGGGGDGATDMSTNEPTQGTPEETQGQKNQPPSNPASEAGTKTSESSSGQSQDTGYWKANDYEGQAIIASKDTFKEAFTTAKNSYLRLSDSPTKVFDVQLNNFASNMQLMYDPSTGDAYLQSINSGADPLKGYYATYCDSPNAMDHNSVFSQLKAYQSNGFPKIEGLE